MNNYVDQMFKHFKQKPSDINGHMETLKRYASECDHVTEMGVRFVVSTWAFLAGRPNKVVSYDININDQVRNLQHKAKELNMSFEFIQASSLDVEIEETDLLFIDTWHVYEQLIKELRLHNEKVRKYIILHDTESYKNIGESYVYSKSTPKKQREGLQKAIDEFLDENNEWTLKEVYKHNNGLTVLQRNRI
jgi:cephalosporin hydroxylase